MDEVQEGLRYLFQTSSKYTLCASGTGHAGMEMAIANLVEPGETVVVGNKGIWVGGWGGGPRRCLASPPPLCPLVHGPPRLPLHPPLSTHALRLRVRVCVTWQSALEPTSWT